MSAPRYHRLRRPALLAAVALGCGLAFATPAPARDPAPKILDEDGGGTSARRDSRMTNHDVITLSIAGALGGLLGCGLGGALMLLGLRPRFSRLRNALESRDTDVLLLADQGSDLVLRLRNGEVTFAVDRLLGYGVSPVDTLPLDALVHAADLAAVEAALASLDGGTLHPKVTCRLLRRDGATVWVEGAFGRLASGTPDIIVTLRDVTRQRNEAKQLGRALDEARAAQSATDEASRAKGDFLASMSHEIRTPLNAIIGFADLLLEDPDLGVRGRRGAERIKAGGDALLTILNDILDYSQLGSGALRLNPRPFVLPLLIDECIALVERLAMAKNLSLRVELVDRFPPGVLGDEARLRQILLNIVNNAVKFTHYGAVTVRIRYERTSRPDRVVFEVSDTGIGIAADEMPNLFQRFRQVDSTVRRSYGGTGLGLAISKMLVEMMGGEIGATSVKGSGSTFWFALDLPAVPLVLQAERKPVRPAAARALTILLVEDTKLNQELARAILETRGHRIDVVCDGAEAIMAVADQTYDLVLMDVQMPYVDGLTATRAIRILPGLGRFVPVVAMTANVMRAQVAAMREAGMDDVLGKPLSLDALDSLLERAGRDAIRAAPDPAAIDQATLAKLTLAVGEPRIDAMLAALATSLSRRFTLPLEPQTAASLKADAQASIATTAMLGFHRFSMLCRRFAEADGASAEVLAALLRELPNVVDLAQRLRNLSRAQERSAA